MIGLRQVDPSVTDALQAPSTVVDAAHPIAEFRMSKVPEADRHAMCALHRRAATGALPLNLDRPTCVQVA